MQAPLSLGGPLGCLFDRDESGALKTLLYIESILTERAALTAASMLAAVIEHCGAARNPLAPVRIAVEGTTFSLYHFLEEALRAHFHSIVNAPGPRFCLMEPVKCSAFNRSSFEKSMKMMFEVFFFSENCYKS